MTGLNEIVPLISPSSNNADAYPRNLQATGPTSNTRAANASPSFNGGGTVSLSRLAKRQVILVGMLARFGGMITRTPE